MKKRGIIFAVISAASLIISLFSLYLAIIILGSADGFLYSPHCLRFSAYLGW